MNPYVPNLLGHGLSRNITLVLTLHKRAKSELMEVL